MFLDLSKVCLLDLSQNFSVNSPAFARYEGPTVKWVKRIAFEGVNAQHISSTIPSTSPPTSTAPGTSTT